MCDKLKKKVSADDYEILKELAGKYADGSLEGLSKFLRTNLKEAVTLNIGCNAKEKEFINEAIKGNSISSYGVKLINDFVEKDGMEQLEITLDCFKNHREKKVTLNIKDKDFYEKLKRYAEQYKLPVTIMMRLGILKELGYPFDEM